MKNLIHDLFWLIERALDGGRKANRHTCIKKVSKGKKDIVEDTNGNAIVLRVENNKCRFFLFFFCLIIN